MTIIFKRKNLNYFPQTVLTCIITNKAGILTGLLKAGGKMESPVLWCFFTIKKGLYICHQLSSPSASKCCQISRKPAASRLANALSMLMKRGKVNCQL